MCGYKYTRIATNYLSLYSYEKNIHYNHNFYLFIKVELFKLIDFIFLGENLCLSPFFPYLGYFCSLMWKKSYKIRGTGQLAIYDTHKQLYSLTVYQMSGTVLAIYHKCLNHQLF